MSPDDPPLPVQNKDRGPGDVPSVHGRSRVPKSKRVNRIQARIRQQWKFQPLGFGKSQALRGRILTHRCNLSFQTVNLRDDRLQGLQF